MEHLNVLQSFKICVLFKISCSPKKVTAKLQNTWNNYNFCLWLSCIISLCTWLADIKLCYFCHIHFTKALHSFLVLCAAADASFCFKFMPRGITFFHINVTKMFCLYINVPLPQFVCFSIYFNSQHTWKSCSHLLCKYLPANLSLFPFTRTNQFHWCLKFLSYLIYLVLNMSQLA